MCHERVLEECVDMWQDTYVVRWYVTWCVCHYMCVTYVSWMCHEWMRWCVAWMSHVSWKSLKRIHWYVTWHMCGEVICHMMCVSLHVCHMMCVSLHVCHICFLSHQLSRFPPCLWPSSGFAFCCSVLQCAAVCCTAVHCVALCCTFCACPSVSLALIMPLSCVALRCTVVHYVVLCSHSMRVPQSLWPYLVLRCVALRCAVVRSVLYSVRASPCLWSQWGVILCIVFVTYPSVGMCVCWSLCDQQTHIPAYPCISLCSLCSCDLILILQCDAHFVIHVSLSFTSLSPCIFLYFPSSIPSSSISPLALSHCPYFVPSLLHPRSLASVIIILVERMFFVDF